MALQTRVVFRSARRTSEIRSSFWVREDEVASNAFCCVVRGGGFASRANGGLWGRGDFGEELIEEGGGFGHCQEKIL